MSANKILITQVEQIVQSIAALKDVNADSLQAVLDNIECLNISAGEYGRVGLQDVCLLVQEIFSDILQITDTLNNEQIALLQQWCLLVANYIRASKPSTLTALTRFLQNTALNATVTEEDILLLQEMLQQEETSFHDLFEEPLAIIAHNPSFGLTLLHDKLTLLLSRQTATPLAKIGLRLQAHINRLQQCHHVALNAQQQQLMIDCLTQFESLLAAPTNTKIALSLINLLQDSACPAPLTTKQCNELYALFGMQSLSETKIPPALAETVKALEQAVAKLNLDDPHSIHLIADHTEQLGLAAAEQLALFGFQDICLIIQENLSDLANDKKSSLQDYQPLIVQWLPLVQNYLSNRDDLDCIQQLFDYLQSQQWPNPLDAADVAVLKDIMIGTAENSTAPEKLETPTPTTQHFTETLDEVIEAIDEVIDEVIDVNDILAAPHTVSKQLIEMLCEEITQIQEDTNKIFTSEQASDATTIVDGLSFYALRLERLGHACQAAELDGLYQVLLLFAKNLNALSEQQTIPAPPLLSLVVSWVANIKHYLQQPGDNDCSNNLINSLHSDLLPHNLMKGVRPALLNLLKAVHISDKDVSSQPRQTVATIEDICIDVPADINAELLDGLLQELPTQTEEFSSAVQNLMSHNNLDELKKAQRIAHTVKGAANTVGIKGIATLTHQLEDIMSMLNDLNHLPSAELATIFIDAADCLEEMSEALIKNNPAPSQSQTVLQNILDWANRIEAEGSQCLTAIPTSTVATTTDDNQEIIDKPDTDESDTILRVPSKLIDNILRLLGETMIVTSQLQERVRLSTSQLQGLIEHQNMVQGLASDLEVQVDLNSTFYDYKNVVNQNEVFDSLELEEYNELNTVTNRIVEASVDSYEFNQGIANDLNELDELLINKLRLHHQIQELMMRTRMVPIKTIVPRLQRIVRQACRATTKQATLEIVGIDTLIDGNILNQLIDPLMHLLRNAIDHGIETSAKRIELHKTETGTIQLKFSREGSQILVQCQDDGGGLDRDVIVAKAIEHGFLDSDSQTQLSIQDINRLILNSGFSTRSQITQTSGRGVGMDVVNNEILAMKGSVHIESEKDQGCSIELRVPLSLISSNALLLRHLNQTIAVSNNGIERILHPRDLQNIELGTKAFCEVDGDRLEIKTLSSLLDLPEDRRGDGRGLNPSLLIRKDELYCVVSIQEIMDTKELFIKSMGQYLNNIKGLLGATILGDGSVVSVIDLPELLRNPVAGLANEDLNKSFSATAKPLPLALVVDDSLSARRALAQSVQDIGFNVRMAKDGLEAIAIIEKRKPDIILTDLEMPRMNGMELTSHVRGFENTKDIPVIMVTSRTTEKHRKQATSSGVNIYLTKPFSENELSDTVHTLLN